jgi:hypothetical protein
MPTVWVVNRSSHDFSPAREWGELRFLSEGPLDKFSVNGMTRQFEEKLRRSSSEDYILLTSLSVMNALACVCFALRHRKLNLLIYKAKGYVARNLLFEQESK